MAADAHAHPRDLLELFPAAEEERRRLGISCAASAWNGEEFSFHEALAAAAEREGAPPIRLCFAVHPQLPALGAGACRGKDAGRSAFRKQLDLLEGLAGEGRLAAIGETGFDLYDDNFRKTEKIQEELFQIHLETALHRDLPLVLHVRRAMEKIFSHTKTLKRLPAVVFHSWPGVPDEGFSLLRRGINAFFSFGTVIMLNHKRAVRSCAAFPAERLLFETDAPWQSLQGKQFSSWGDLPAVLGAAAALRREAEMPGGDAAELERVTDQNFYRVFGGGI